MFIILVAGFLGNILLMPNLLNTDFSKIYQIRHNPCTLFAKKTLKSSKIPDHLNKEHSDKKDNDVTYLQDLAKSA